MQKLIENDKQELINDIKKYIDIIEKEYGKYTLIQKNLNFNNIVHIEDTNTISLFIRNNEFYFPLSAYFVLNSFKKIKEYRSIPNHKTYTKETLIINDNTFYNYIEHLILKGATPIEYFKEILLHETMHYCGANGSSALMEGLNEYFTRKLALKHNLLTNGCGYPKEIKIVLKLIEILGEEKLLKMLFSKSKEDIKNILSEKEFNFFNNLNDIMEEEFYNKYYKFDFPGLNGPFEKAKKYNDINYEKAHHYIEKFILSLVQFPLKNRIGNFYFVFLLSHQIQNLK